MPVRTRTRPSRCSDSRARNSSGALATGQRRLETIRASMGFSGGLRNDLWASWTTLDEAGRDARDDLITHRKRLSDYRIRADDRAIAEDNAGHDDATEAQPAVTADSDPVCPGHVIRIGRDRKSTRLNSSH